MLELIIPAVLGVVILAIAASKWLKTIGHDDLIFTAYQEYNDIIYAIRKAETFDQLNTIERSIDAYETRFSGVFNVSERVLNMRYEFEEKQHELANAVLKAYR